MDLPMNQDKLKKLIARIPTGQLKSDEIEPFIQQMRKYLIEQTLQGEMDTYLGYARYERHSSINSRNGSSKKTITTEKRPIAISVPRDLEAGSSSKLSPSNKPERECLMTKSLPEFGANGQITKELAPLGSEYTFEEILNTLQTVQALTTRDGKMQMMEVTKRQHEIARRLRCPDVFSGLPAYVAQNQLC